MNACKIEEIRVSKHAYQRSSERCGWKRKTTNRMIKKVMTYGRDARKEKGYLKPWIKQEVEKGDDLTLYILFGEWMFIAKNNVVITVLNVPKRSRREMQKEMEWVA